MKARAFGFAVGIALAAGAVAPADAQFFANYPVIIVPPPAQNMAIPKPAPRPAAKPAQPATAAAPGNAPAQTQCHFQGQTRVCE